MGSGFGADIVGCTIATARENAFQSPVRDLLQRTVSIGPKRAGGCSCPATCETGQPEIIDVFTRLEYASPQDCSALLDLLDHLWAGVAIDDFDYLVRPTVGAKTVAG